MIDETSLDTIISNMTANGAAEKTQQGREPQAGWQCNPAATG